MACCGKGNTGSPLVNASQYNTRSRCFATTVGSTTSATRSPGAMRSVMPDSACTRPKRTSTPCKSMSQRELALEGMFMRANSHRQVCRTAVHTARASASATQSPHGASVRVQQIMPSASARGKSPFAGLQRNGSGHHPRETVDVLPTIITAPTSEMARLNDASSTASKRIALIPGQQQLRSKAVGTHGAQLLAMGALVFHHLPGQRRDHRQHQTAWASTMALKLNNQPQLAQRPTARQQ